MEVGCVGERNVPGHAYPASGQYSTSPSRRRATVGARRTTPAKSTKPLGEMPKWRVVRQVLMTHGFMHLGEMNVLRGMMGLQFSI